MTLGRLKEIEVLNADIALLEERRAVVYVKATSTACGGWEVKRTKNEDGREDYASALRTMPRSGAKSDKVADGAIELCEIDRKLERAKRRRARLIGYIRRIEDDYVQSALLLKFEKGYTWDRIAVLIGNRTTGDSVRKTCERFLACKKKRKR